MLTTLSFWMKYGTPVFIGKPFIWSESQWKNQKLRDVPNVVTEVGSSFESTSADHASYKA
jgi:hypothetical protein